MRDPYAIFASHVLKLDALEPSRSTRAPPTAAPSSTRFSAASPSEHPKSSRRCARRSCCSAARTPSCRSPEAYPELYAEWWPRFERLAAEFVVWEQRSRAAISPEVHAERRAMPIPLAGRQRLHLRARADRIEARRDGCFAIIDFKTGQPPEPQGGLRRLLAAAHARGRDADAGRLQGPAHGDKNPDLLYVHTSGGREPSKPRGDRAPKDEDRSVPRSSPSTAGAGEG